MRNAHISEMRSNDLTKNENIHRHRKTRRSNKIIKKKGHQLEGLEVRVGVRIMVGLGLG
jgi:hypothetical protein